MTIQRKTVLFLLVFALCLATAQASVTVAVSTPSSTTATVATTTQISARATSLNPISGWYIYVDGNGIWNTGAAASISPLISLAVGTHNVMVRAWDTTGAFGTTFLTLTAVQSSSPVVNIVAPAGTSATAPVTFQASATSKYPITGYVVYANNVNVLQANGGTLNGQATLAAGSYSIRIRAWDTSGAYGDASKSLTVGAGTGVPTPPSTATVFDKIEDRATWGDCSDCAADPNKPNPPIAQYYRAQYQTSPSLDGSSIKFWIGGSTAYANALHWTKFGDQGWAKNFIWEYWVYGQADSLKAQNLEFDLWQSVGGRKYMFGTQCNYIKGVWQGWNEPVNSWVDLPTVPCVKFAPGVWTRVVWYFQRTSDNQLKYVSLTVGNTTFPINMIQPSSATTWANSLGVQFQQDLNYNADDYSLWVDKIKLSIW